MKEGCIGVVFWVNSGEGNEGNVGAWGSERKDGDGFVRLNLMFGRFSVLRVGESKYVWGVWVKREKLVSVAIVVVTMVVVIIAIVDCRFVFGGGVRK